jgi:hypothetical protein
LDDEFHNFTQADNNDSSSVFGKLVFCFSDKVDGVMSSVLAVDNFIGSRRSSPSDAEFDLDFVPLTIFLQEVPLISASSSAHKQLCNKGDLY